MRRAPFARLVGHFVRRIVRPGGDAELGAGPLLGLLIAPGAAHCFLSLEKYSSLMAWFTGRVQQDLLIASLPDKLLYVALSMVLTALVTVARWDRLLPDAQDYQNLGVLPLRRGWLAWASAAAIGIVATAVNVAVNLVPAVLFPLMVSAADPDRRIAAAPFLAVHWTMVSMASLFGFATVMAVMGVAALAGARVVLVVRVALAAGFLYMGALAWAVPRGRAVAWFPPAWFASLYQVWQGRATAWQAELAAWAWQATAMVLVLAVLASALVYRRRFRERHAAGRRTGAGSPWDVLRWVLPGGAFVQAVRGFALSGLLRQDPQRLIMLVAVAFGWLVALPAARGYPAVVLVPAYLLVLAAAVAFRIPASLGANWILRVTLENAEHPVGGAVRQCVLLVLAVFVWLPAAWLLPATATVVVVGMSLIHVEAVFGRWNSIPFTRARAEFRQSFPVVALLQLVLLAVYVTAGARLMASRALWVLPVAWVALRWWNRSPDWGGGLDDAVPFENPAVEDVQTLRLSG